MPKKKLKPYYFQSLLFFFPSLKKILTRFLERLSNHDHYGHCIIWLLTPHRLFASIRLTLTRLNTDVPCNYIHDMMGISASLQIIIDSDHVRKPINTANSSRGQMRSDFFAFPSSFSEKSWRNCLSQTESGEETWFIQFISHLVWR